MIYFLLFVMEGVMLYILCLPWRRHFCVLCENSCSAYVVLFCMLVMLFYMFENIIYIVSAFSVRACANINNGGCTCGGRELCYWRCSGVVY
jgi:hypothetical protein